MLVNFDLGLVLACLGGMCLGVLIMVPFGIWFMNAEFERYHEPGWATKNLDWDYD